MKKASPKKYLTPIIFGVVVLVIVIFAAIALRSPDKGSGSSDSDTGTVQTVTGKQLDQLQTGWSQGPDDAKVTLVEFGDYQCPSCGNAFPILKNEILPKYDGKLKFVFKNFPLVNLHKNAMAAAQAAESAGSMGKYWEMHDILYEKQDDWATLSDPVDKFGEYADQIGLNGDKLKGEVRDEKYTDKIKVDMNLGDKLKIQGTPSFYVNGHYIDTSTSGLVAVTNAIDAELQK